VDPRETSRAGLDRRSGPVSSPTIFGRVRPLPLRLSRVTAFSAARSARLALALALATVLAGAIAPAAASEPTALLIFENASPAEVRAIVSAAGARVIALFPGASTALVAGPDASLAALVADPRVAAGSQGALTGEESRAPEPQRLAAAAWNRMKTPVLGPLAAAPGGDPLVDDAIEPRPPRAGGFESPPTRAASTAARTARAGTTPASSWQARSR